VDENAAHISRSYSDQPSRFQDAPELCKPSNWVSKVFQQSVREHCIEAMLSEGKIIDAGLAKFDRYAFTSGLLARFCKLRVLEIDSRHNPRRYLPRQSQRDRTGAAASVEHRPARH